MPALGILPLPQNSAPDGSPAPRLSYGNALWSLPCLHRHFHRYTPWHPQKWFPLFFPGLRHNRWLLPKSRRSWWSLPGLSHSQWNGPGGGRGGRWYMPSTIPLLPDARSLWKSGAFPVRWLPLPSRCHWRHGQAGWHCCKAPQSFEEVLHDAHRALSGAVRLRSGNVKIPPCSVHSLRPARPDGEVLSHSDGQALHGFVFSSGHLPFLLLIFSFLPLSRFLFPFLLIGFQALGKHKGFLSANEAQGMFDPAIVTPP